MVTWKFFLQDGGISESFTHKMAACKFCLQDGGVSDGFTHKVRAFLRVYPQDDDVEVVPTRWRPCKTNEMLTKKRRIYLTFAFSESHVTASLSPGVTL